MQLLSSIHLQHLHQTLAILTYGLTGETVAETDEVSAIDIEQALNAEADQNEAAIETIEADQSSELNAQLQAILDQIIEQRAVISLYSDLLNRYHLQSKQTTESKAELSEIEQALGLANVSENSDIIVTQESEPIVNETAIESPPNVEITAESFAQTPQEIETLIEDIASSVFAQSEVVIPEPEPPNYCQTYFANLPWDSESVIVNADTIRAVQNTAIPRFISTATVSILESAQNQLSDLNCQTYFERLPWSIISLVHEVNIATTESETSCKTYLSALPWNQSNKITASIVPAIIQKSATDFTIDCETYFQKLPWTVVKISQSILTPNVKLSENTLDFDCQQYFTQLAWNKTPASIAIEIDQEKVNQALSLDDCQNYFNHLPWLKIKQAPAISVNTESNLILTAGSFFTAVSWSITQKSSSVIAQQAIPLPAEAQAFFAQIPWNKTLLVTNQIKPLINLASTAALYFQSLPWLPIKSTAIQRDSVAINQHCEVYFKELPW